MTTLIADVEADGLLDTITKIHCISIEEDVPGAEKTTYADYPGYPSISDGLRRLRDAERIVFHNGLGYDLFALNAVYPGTVRFEQVVDSLVLGRMRDPESRKLNLADIGESIGIAKIENEDWSVFTPHMGERCEVDIGITGHFVRDLRKGWKHSKESVQAEHQVALVISLQEQNGFPFDVVKAQKLEAELREEQLDIETRLQEEFPPLWVALGGKSCNSVIYPRLSKTIPVKVPKSGDIKTKSGTVSKTPYVKDAPFTPVSCVTFNPGSRQHISARLRMAGWKPRKFTASGEAKLDEDTLFEVETLYPEAAGIARYLRVGKQLGQLADGDNAWLKLCKEDKEGVSRIHGRVNPCGTQTHRMAHFAPNVAQADAKDPRMREPFQARPGWKLVGADADAIEACGLAHYLASYDGGAFIKHVSEGDKDAGTDIHTRNLKMLRMYKRGKGVSVKNWFYGYLK